jgi:hypothetical protein
LMGLTPEAQGLGDLPGLASLSSRPPDEVPSSPSALGEGVAAADAMPRDPAPASLRGAMRCGAVGSRAEPELPALPGQSQRRA